MFHSTRHNCTSNSRPPLNDCDDDPLEVQLVHNLKTIHHRHHLTYVCGLASLIYLFGETSIHAGHMKPLLDKAGEEYDANGSNLLLLSLYSLWEKMVRRGIDRGELRGMEPRRAAVCLLEGPLSLLRMHAEQRLRAPLFSTIRESWDLAWQKMEGLFYLPPQ